MKVLYYRTPSSQKFKVTFSVKKALTVIFLKISFRLELITSAKASVCILRTHIKNHPTGPYHCQPSNGNRASGKGRSLEAGRLASLVYLKKTHTNKRPDSSSSEIHPRTNIQSCLLTPTRVSPCMHLRVSVHSCVCTQTIDESMLLKHKSTLSS